MTTTTPMNSATLRERFNAARTEGKRAREAAESLGVSEGAAVAAHCGEHEYAPKAIQLKGPWVELLQALEACGPVMGLTRNETTVHEKIGVYEKISAQGHVGLALGEDIDLRLFFSQWHAGFAVTELAANPGNRAQASLQFFDRHGKAVHKIFSREATVMDRWQQVIARFTDSEGAVPVFEPAAAEAAPKADDSIDADALADGWAAMQDTHEFFGLLKKHGAERQQSFRLVEGRFTRQLATQAVHDMLTEAAFEGLPIMCFVGNTGCIQIHSGPVQRIEPMDIPSRTPGQPATRWLNVLDPGFNLHLREDQIAHVWFVEKPTSDGLVTSVEAFDRDGGLMAMFFGARKPGKPENPAWRALAERQAPLAPAAAEALA